MLTQLGKEPFKFYSTANIPPLLNFKEFHGFTALLLEKTIHFTCILWQIALLQRKHSRNDKFSVEYFVKFSDSVGFSAEIFRKYSNRFFKVSKLKSVCPEEQSEAELFC